MRERIKDAAYWTERALETWAEFMRQGGGPDGLPDHALALEGYTTLDANSERAYEKLDAWIAETTHTAVAELVPAQNAAIYCCYLHAVYRFPRENYDVMLDLAKANVQLGLKSRGVWLGE